jgi:DNA mismatch repair protein MutS
LDLIMTEDITPLMRQYLEIKNQFPEEIVFFRMGDFYEMFGEDAKVASQILGIALTSRGQIKGEKIPLAGVPYHAGERYLSQLLKAGKKVVICEQTEDPRLAKGIVKRAVTEVITPGTVMVEGVIQENQNNYLASLYQTGEKMGMAFLDLSTGEFKLDEGETYGMIERLRVLSPAEIIVPHNWTEEKIKSLRMPDHNASFTFLEEWKFDYQFAYQSLVQHLKVNSLEGFGCENLKLGISAAGAIWAYLKQTKKSVLSHINRLSPIFSEEVMFLDANTIRNLELLSPLRGGDKDATLFSLLNRAKTTMGGRLLKNWIIRPLLSAERIKERQEAIGEFLRRREWRGEMIDRMGSMADLERLAGRIGCDKATPRDLIWLKNSLKPIPGIKSLLKKSSQALFVFIRENLPDTSSLVQLLESSLVDEPPISLTEGGIIKSGYSGDLDRLKESIIESKRWIAGLQEEERKKRGIPSLKVGFNRIYGYFVEVTKPHLSKVPQEYIRKQTMVNAERFITHELKEKEDFILGAEEKIFNLERELFLQLRSRVAEQTSNIQKTAEMVAILDVLTGLSEVAEKRNYVRPQVDAKDEITIEEGRHPVIESLLEPGNFVPNSTRLDSTSEQIHIITGPNMAGKSTYLRQVGIIVLLAQMGSYVPAKVARIGMVDRIFTRVGAADYLTAGQSTFLVEMIETANILHNATPKSLILLDEVGRGTSTFDGLSIAWAVTEHIHNHAPTAAKTLFATHYHELTELAHFLPRVKNYNVAVKEWGEEIVFLRKIVPGGCDDSYGIQVARLAGMPQKVLDRSREILAELEMGETSCQKPPQVKPKPVSYQLSIFSPAEHQISEELKELDLDKITPLEAMNKLSQLKRKAE